MKEQAPKMKTIALYVLLLIIFLTAFTNIANTKKVEKIKYSEFLKMLGQKANPRVMSVKINDREITGQAVSTNLLSPEKGAVQMQFQTVAPDDPGIMQIIRDSGVTIEAEPPAQMSWWLNLLINWFPFILLIGAWIYRQGWMQDTARYAAGFRRALP